MSYGQKNSQENCRKIVLEDPPVNHWVTLVPFEGERAIGEWRGPLQCSPHRERVLQFSRLDLGTREPNSVPGAFFVLLFFSLRPQMDFEWPIGP